jgi:hypothetical protein
LKKILIQLFGWLAVLVLIYLAYALVAITMIRKQLAPTYRKAAAMDVNSFAVRQKNSIMNSPEVKVYVPSKVVISSISPSAVPQGSEMTIIGSGFMSAKDSISIDTVPADDVVPLNDTMIKYKLPIQIVDGRGCQEFKEEIEKKNRENKDKKIVAMGGCDPGFISIGPGQHTIAIQNENGVSDTFSFKVLPFEGHAFMDSTSMDPLGNLVVSGVAEGVSTIYGKVCVTNYECYTIEPLSVINGRWSIALKDAKCYIGCSVGSRFRNSNISDPILLMIFDQDSGLKLFEKILDIKKTGT